MMTAKLYQQRFWHCHENRLVETIPTISHYLGTYYWDPFVKLISKLFQNLCRQSLPLPNTIDERVVHSTDFRYLSIISFNI